MTGKALPIPAGRAGDEALERVRNREALRYHLGVKSRMRLVAAAVVVATGAPMPAAQTQGQAPAVADSTASRFPPGPGRDTLFRVCADCHGPESVLGHLKTHDEWSKTLDEMANNGAAGSDEDWHLIQGYLDRHYSLILINKAPAKDLASTLDVPEGVAQAIVRIREQGGIKTIADLKRVPDIDGPKIDALKDRLVF
jgi:cytochrome c5